MTNQPHVYPVEVRWTVGREGVSRSDRDGIPDIVVETPPQFGGRGGNWTPEHLFVASAASCLMTTFMTMASFSKLAVHGFDVAAEGKLEQTDGRHYQMTEIVLRPFVQITEERFRAKTLRLLEKAENACLITASMRSRVYLEPVVAVVCDDSTAVPAAG